MGRVLEGCFAWFGLHDVHGGGTIVLVPWSMGASMVHGIGAHGIWGDGWVGVFGCGFTRLLERD